MTFRLLKDRASLTQAHPNSNEILAWPLNQTISSVALRRDNHAFAFMPSTISDNGSTLSDVPQAKGLLFIGRRAHDFAKPPSERNLGHSEFPRQSVV